MGQILQHYWDICFSDYTVNIDYNALLYRYNIDHSNV